jgi:hypothetical protein
MYPDLANVIREKSHTKARTALESARQEQKRLHDLLRQTRERLKAVEKDLVRIASENARLLTENAVLKAKLTSRNVLELHSTRMHPPAVQKVGWDMYRCWVISLVTRVLDRRLIGALCCFAVGGLHAVAAEDLRIERVNIVSPETASVIRNASVDIHDGRIAAISSSSGSDHPSGLSSGGKTIGVTNAGSARFFQEAATPSW